MPPTRDFPPAIRISEVSRSFPAGRRVVLALDNISAQAAQGDVTGLIGPDGAGKTTLMRLIAGLLRADSGRIEVLGTDVARAPLAVQSRLSYMPQRFGLYEDLSVQENLDLYADLQGVPRDDRAARYADLLHMTGLGPFTSRLAGRLSGGMKQKLGLACTLVHPPEILLLDEPTVGVDPVSRRELWQIIDHLICSAATTVLFSTAYLDEAERCGAVLLMHEGKLIGAGNPKAFTARMAGRGYRVRVGSIGKRAAQERLSRAAGIMDAIIQGDSVRIVTDEAKTPDSAQLLPGVDDVAITAAAPRFEDSFVALLRARSPTRGRPPAPLPVHTVTAEDVILVQHVTRDFGAFRAVDDVSFTVRAGEIFGLLGANGAGKSTTFRMLCGLLPPTAGSLRVAGFDLRNAAAPARGRIGYMAQKFSLYGDLSVRQNLRFFSSAYRLTGARQLARIDWALDEFDLGGFADAACGDLPLGFKQRIALACALMHEPEILFLDEPTSGVDPLARREPANPDPTMEDAFVALIQAAETKGNVA